MCRSPLHVQPTHPSQPQPFPTRQELKAQYKALTGEDWGGAPAGDKKKEKKPVAEAGAPKVDARKAAKEARAAKRAADASASATPAPAPAPAATATGGAPKETFGPLPLVQSQAMTEKVWERINDLGPGRAGARVLLRGRLQTSRAVGKGVFVLLRQGIYSVQAVMFQGGAVSKEMVKFAAAISKESVIDIVVRGDGGWGIDV